MNGFELFRHNTMALLTYPCEKAVHDLKAYFILVNVHNTIKIYACAELNLMSIEHTAVTLYKKLDFYILQTFGH